MSSLRSFCANLKTKIVGDPLPPNRVAAGWALGMFIGCSIPFGVQLIISIPLAILMKVSKIGATAATFITNPITIFILYPAQTLVAHRLIFGASESITLPTEWTFNSVMSLSSSLIISFLLGGLGLALILTPITYFVVKYIVIKYRKICPKVNI